MGAMGAVEAVGWAGFGAGGGVEAEEAVGAVEAEGHHHRREWSHVVIRAAIQPSQSHLGSRWRGLGYR